MDLTLTSGVITERHLHKGISLPLCNIPSRFLRHWHASTFARIMWGRTESALAVIPINVSLT
jgi:hypothetical protein